MDERELEWAKENKINLLDVNKIYARFLTEEEMKLPIADRDRLARLKRAELSLKFDKQENTLDQEEAQVRNEIIMLLAQKNPDRDGASEKIVEYIKKHNHIFTVRDDKLPEMYIYHNGIYIPNGETIIKEIIRRIMQQAFRTQFCNDVINKIMADTYIDSEKFFGVNYKEEIAVQNGILNIRTRELSQFNHNKIFFAKCPVIYNPKAKCDIIESFLCDVLSNPEDRLVYYEIGGFCLLKEYTYEKAFMFIGTGRNGKGKSLELIKRVVGAENTISLPLAALQHDNADVSQLWTKMVNLAGDIGFQDLKDTSMFKSLTGRDLVTARRKFKTAIIFENYSKFVFACNELPRVYDMSMGFWDRWVLLEFPYYFADKDKWEEAPVKDKDKIKLRDENIIDKIAHPEQLSGLLNAFLDGLDRLVANGKFSSTKGTDEIKNMWIRKSDSFQAFCMDNIELNPEGIIIKKELKQKFAKYWKEHNLKPISDKAIKISLEMHYGASEAYRMAGNNQEYVWEGISWKK